MKRYPLDPLLNAMGMSHNQACYSLGLSGSTQQEYRRRGVTERVADRLAVKAGLIAYEVWPEMVDDAIASVQKRCERPDCARPFVPLHHRARFCTKRCKDVEGNRRRRQRPEVAQQARESAARYYAEHTDYVRRNRRRRYYEAMEAV